MKFWKTKSFDVDCTSTRAYTIGSTVWQQRQFVFIRLKYVDLLLQLHFPQV